MIRFIKRFCNNLNWTQRDIDMKATIINYHYVLNLPRRTNNRITPDSYIEHTKHHNKIVYALLDKYGNGWADYLSQYIF